MKAAESNFIQSDNGYAIKANTDSDVSLYADKYNYLSGAVYASGTGAAVDLIGNQTSSSKTNYVYSTTVIEKAGDLDSSSIVSALYAEDGS